MLSAESDRAVPLLASFEKSTTKKLNLWCYINWLPQPIGWPIPGPVEHGFKLSMSGVFRVRIGWTGHFFRFYGIFTHDIQHKHQQYSHQCFACQLCAVARTSLFFQCS
mmetsp:Transcript_52612/g.107906  ORF Transcript_52612/g.107906 Transcript_52612/m.107906 type:complete len:108 (-) Transcript_52612:1252-1575(-)